MIMKMLMSWWQSRRRRKRFIFLILCSPFLLPVFCLTFPWLCLVHFCCKRRNTFINHRRHSRKEGEEEEEDTKISIHEQGSTSSASSTSTSSNQEGRLLHRYLEDQLDLVIQSVYYDCSGGGDDDDDEFSCVLDVDGGGADESTPLLS